MTTHRAVRLYTPEPLHIPPPADADLADFTHLLMLPDWQIARIRKALAERWSAGWWWGFPAGLLVGTAAGAVLFALATRPLP